MSLSIYGGGEVITIATISIILSTNKWSDLWAGLSQFAYHQKIFWDENTKTFNFVEIRKRWVRKDNDPYMILNGSNGWERMTKRYNMITGSQVLANKMIAYLLI